MTRTFEVRCVQCDTDWHTFATYADTKGFLMHHPDHYVEATVTTVRQG